MLDGLAPGVQAFVLDPDSDGFEQIANTLAANDLTDFSSISIVGHGSSGAIDVGGTTLDDANLATYATELAQISARLAPGGDLQLYACETAAGAAGQQFIADLSQYAGGGTVDASDQDVGLTAAGENWTLDATAGAPGSAPVAPFTAQAESGFQGALSLTTDVIVFDASNQDSGPLDIGTRVEQFAASGSTPIAGSTIDIADASQASDSGLRFANSGIAVDSALHEYFVAADNTSTHVLTIQEGTLSNGGSLHTFVTNPFPDIGGSGPVVAVVGGLALDAVNGELYFAQTALDSNGNNVAADMGIYRVSINGGTPTLVNSTSNTLFEPTYLALDVSANLLFFTDAFATTTSGGLFPSVNNLDVMNLSTGAITVLHSFTPQETSDPNFQLEGLAIDSVNNVVYLATVNSANAASADNAILRIPFTPSGSGTSATASIGTISTLYSGAGADQPSDIVIAPAQGIFYATGEEPTFGGFYGAVFEGSLSGGSTLTKVLSMDSVVPGAALNDQLPQLVLLTQPTVTASGTVTAVTGGGAMLVDAGLTVADQDGQNMASATVTGVLTGDTLSFNNGNVFTFGDGDQISSSFSGGTLTLSGNATTADYASALDAVKFATTSTSATPRTIDWTVSDGVVTSPTTTSTVDVHVPPVVTAGASVTFDGGGSPVVLNSGLVVTDASSSTLAGATIVIVGSISADRLNFSAQNGIAGMYNATTGTLVLSGVASVVNYETALESITYSVSPSNSDPTGGGSDTTRTIDWTVNVGALNSGTVTSALDTVHVASTVTASGTVDFGFGGSPVTLDPTTTVSDADSGGNLSSATVSIGTGYVSGDDTLSFTSKDGITGSFSSGALNLSGTASLTDYDAVLQSVRFDTTSATTGSRTIDWSVNDGVALSATATSTVDVAPCYCPGTLIKTKRGDKRVEKLKIGDKVMTASGKLRPIKWIGRRSYGGRFVMGRKDILPICIKAGALDDNVPRRDLWISPHHAMYLETVLIEAKDLINGVSIVQAERVDKVEYFHIELDTHDVIIAEGALSESFIDDDSRGMFHNAHEYCALYPDVPADPARYCAPRLDEGYEVEAVRRGIAQRAGLLRAADGPRTGELRGYIDLVSETCIAGWAQNADHPEAPVCLDIYTGGRLIGQVLANCNRDDLKRAGLGSGRHAFIFKPPADFASVLDPVEVRRSLDGAALPPSAHVKRAHPPTAA